MAHMTIDVAAETSVQIDVGPATLDGNLLIPHSARGVVLFAHGSGSGRKSPRNRSVAAQLREAGLATILVDLLTEREEFEERHTAHLRFDIGMLADRLVGITDWLANDPRTSSMSVGYFGASTGGAAALVAATQRPDRVGAVVSRGGRPDLAGDALLLMRAPVLLIVGGADTHVLALNDAALERLQSPTKKLLIVPRATHLFEEPGALEEVARLATDWFTKHLVSGMSET
jgi:putative phosphoribosyl transferase